MLNPDAMVSLAQTHYMRMIVDKHGNAGMEPLRNILQALRRLYERVAPETLKHRLIMFATVDPELRPISAPDETFPSILSIENVADQPVILQMLNDGRVLLWRDREVDVLAFSETSVVYTYESEVEHFRAKGESLKVDKLVIGCASSFAVPTYSDLHEALAHYASAMVRASSCPILSKIWYDDKRLFLVAGPEYHMRDSLTHFLKARLRGNFEVRPEQVVDSSHPVDIKVTWWMTNRLALIEIKWLGQSREVAKLGTKHTESRAREGAQQLADYLNSNRSQAPQHQTRGYLVVIDARRARLGLNTTTLPLADAMKYQHQAISYDPDFEQTRTDYHKPLRMFAEPKVG